MQAEEKNIINKILTGYGLDHEWAVFREIIETCGLNFDDEYIENEALLTPDLLESHYDDILKLIQNKELAFKDLPYSDRLIYMVLGALIVLTNAKLPVDLRQKIIDSADWGFELKNRWRKVDDEFIEKREKILTFFQERLKNHEPGLIIDVDPYEVTAGYDVFEEKLGDKFLKTCKVGSLEEITKEILEANLNKILFLFEEEPSYCLYEDYLLLGALVLKTGALIPENLQQRLIEITDWEEEVKKRWNLRDEDFLQRRKEILIAFQDIIRKYPNN